MARLEQQPQSVLPEAKALTPTFDFEHNPHINEAIALAGDAPVVLVDDVDETQLDTIRVHVQRHNRIYRLSFERGSNPWGLTQEQIDSLPTYEQACAAGGTHAAYAHIPAYPEIHGRIMHNAAHNRNIPPIHKDHPTLIQELDKAGYPTVLHLTTRDAKLTDVTRENLRLHDFPDAPVLARPTSIDAAHTTPWKIAALQYIKRRIPGKVVMIDDSVGLAAAIHALNDPDIISVLYEGPITRNPDGLPSANWHTMLSHLQSRIQHR